MEKLEGMLCALNMSNTCSRTEKEALSSLFSLRDETRSRKKSAALWLEYSLGKRTHSLVLLPEQFVLYSKSVFI